MEERLTDLEIRLTHHEAAISEINEVLLKQQALLESMRNDLTTLQRQIREITPSQIATLSEESPPPHY